MAGRTNVTMDENGLPERYDEFLHPDADREFMATIVDFPKGELAGPVLEVPVHELLNDPSRYSDPTPLGLRWFHLPANNMRWVEALMINLCGHATASEILRTNRWAGQQHDSFSRANHARFMHPTYKKFGPFSECDFNYGTTFPQMPYLSWDVEAQPGVPISVADQKLLAAYCDDEHPLHIRRTLDQYFYHTLQDTRSRDMDQVISRFQREHALKPTILTMVDQLWLWLVPDIKGLPFYVITCFPQVTPKSVLVDPPDRRGLADVLTGITLGLPNISPEHRSGQARQALELIALIACTCSSSYMDPSSCLLFRGTIVRFSDVYESTVRAAMAKEAEIFQQFSKSTTRSDLVDITREVSLLREMKDVMDELNIMSKVFTDQLNVLPHLWSFNDENKYSKGVETMLDKIRSIVSLAEKVTSDLHILVDLKQKHSTMMDARATARQGKTLMVFTVVTIVFLPLSFMAAFFALDITQFRREEGGTLDLAYVSKIMFPISAAITVILIYFAFKVEDLEIGWQKIAWKKDEDDSNDMWVSTEEEAAATRWNEQESRDLTKQTAPIRRKTNTTKECTVVSKGKEVAYGDVEAQHDALDPN